MACTSPRGKMVVWTIPLLLVPLFLLMYFPEHVQSKYAHGAWRSGKKLVGPPVLKERHVASHLQCLTLCDGIASCDAFNLVTVTSSFNCQLFEEKACPGHQLVADSLVDYYDVYDQPISELQLPFWDDSVCTDDGYCSTYCSARVVGDVCAGDAHCSSPTLTPPGAYDCPDGTCHLSDDFWEVRQDLRLPRWLDWILYPWVQTYKKLKLGTCSVDVSLKLGIGAVAELGATVSDAQIETRLMFTIGLNTTDLHYYDSGNSHHSIVTGANTAGMVSTDAYSRLKVSWCNGVMSIGPDENPTLVNGQASVNQAMHFISSASTGPESWLRVDESAADAWLFDEAGTGPDPVFEVEKSVVTRSIAPSDDVTVKYDCKAEWYCSVYLRGAYPEMLTIWIGAYKNTKSSLTYENGVGGPYLETVATGPVLNVNEFNTFTVRYNKGSVTVFRNDAAVPMYNVTAPRLLQAITSVGIGSLGYGTRKWIRVARYDPGWKTDSWLTHGVGFSNADDRVFSP